MLLVKVATGSQVVPIVQQYFVSAIPLTLSVKLTIGEATVLPTTVDEGEKVAVGAVVSHFGELAVVVGAQPPPEAVEVLQEQLPVQSP